MEFQEVSDDFVAEQDLLQEVMLLKDEQIAPGVEELVLHPKEGAGPDQPGQAGTVLSIIIIFIIEFSLIII